MTAAGNCALQKFNAGIVSMCVLGFVISCYVYTVEVKMEENDSYQPLCDISEHISCSKVFMTEYGKGFGLFPKDSMFNIPNPIYGLVFYMLVAILSMINDYTFSAATVVVGIISNIFTIYLSSILYLYRDICIVCISTYIINMVITFLAVKKFRKFQKLSSDDMHKKVK
ncbi:PREDICTED: vitamin K epoxide reductase complex subunit 1-like protein 1 [Cyphomyrmex costatus]|uniref:vitamin K epoxide reductase complex subunit 1-like protein 1 n=1 Tax=Cyphomyrmex costatus TaxID=456900 RepID=UPI0008522150|nr:PREDICTED: vitamin K epoxide reductase complex subunit 1-like protein 1 [Cyphomyrmex costatus]